MKRKICCLREEIVMDMCYLGYCFFLPRSSRVRAILCVFGYWFSVTTEAH